MVTSTFQINDFMDFLITKLACRGCSFELKQNQGAELESSTREILGFKAKIQNWREKIDVLEKLGYTGLDLQSALSSKNEGEKSEYYLMSRIDFSVPDLAMVGQIEFFSEMKGSTFFREVTFATFRTRQHSMVELSYSWQEGTKLHGYSLFEFTKDPEEFIKKRF